MSDVAQKVQNAQKNLKKGIKSYIFDILALSILITLIALSLGIIERREITFEELGDIFVECIPFFFAAMLLNNNYYTKGIFAGKETTIFQESCEEYSKLISNLTGKQIDAIDDFCHEFNDNALEKIQDTYLKRASISYEKFNDKTSPLKILSKKELIKIYGKERTKWIEKAKNCHVKGLRVNTLLGTNDSDDITDIGKTEAQLSTKQTWTSAIGYLFSTFLLALLGVKNIMEWGWFGIALVIFKCVFILCRAYMSYFDGYNDVTIHLVNHTNRKTDILKQFIPWFDDYDKKCHKKEN